MNTCIGIRYHKHELVYYCEHLFIPQCTYTLKDDNKIHIFQVKNSGIGNHVISSMAYLKFRESYLHIFCQSLVDT